MNNDKCQGECKTREVNGSVKCVIYLKIIMCGILLHVAVKMGNVYRVIQKLFQLILNNKKQLVQDKVYIFSLYFINYYSIIDRIAASIYSYLIKYQAKQKH